MSDLVDLHMHSQASDGDYPPAELMKLSKAEGRVAVALTDHDTMEGIPEARAAARELGMRFVHGVELSVSYGKRDIHLLGYFKGFNPESGFNSYLKNRLEMRARRLKKIVEKLTALGIRVKPEEILAEAGEAPVGRPHIARVLMKKGHVGSTQEAFDRYLHNDGPAYVRYEKLAVAEAIVLVHDAGGLAVLAHPGIYNLASADISPLVEAGLDGLEARHSEHTLGHVDVYGKMAGEMGLFITGGSDYHGKGVHHGFNEPASTFNLEEAQDFFLALENLPS